ncbi:PIG-L family deacetylase [Mucilaginibacter ginsenosidivorans]|uniref:PIG-L family deacetylase n=1 Tax=Mucilaginibacter ginsenosidivorans TaxID=398053 RepID=A0A5B8UTP5_9SPHI|nr:PIG-L family deacetylase [Mucilaginibacter ginsenosidivorans]QEC61771.1 PIG-L family deacetylase [Mucilaginibacter ginsenosidivorans]
MKRIVLLFISLFIIFEATAQTNPPADMVTIEQNLKKLDVLGSVLYVAAHPDDENTRLLGYLAQEKHYRAGYLSMTRGDGGQNLIGNEQGELLGLVRTQELLAARKVDGAEQFFTRAIDFGFSKGPQETLDFWNKEKVLGDVVWVIRKFRPDVIICRFPTTGEGGHGNHTASAILAQEAFAAAADPKRYPEQLKYVQVWQAKRLLWNTFNFGNTNTISPDQFKINVGVYNPLLGKGYGELAAESRSNHKTQGFGSARQRGDAFEYFKTILGDAPKDDLMDGVNTTWSRVKGGEAIGKDVEAIQKNFDPDHPDRSVADMVKVYSEVEKLGDTYWREQKTRGLADLIAASAGLWFESYANEQAYSLGDSIDVRSQVLCRYNDRSKVNVVDGMNFGGGGKSIPVNEVQTFNSKVLAAKITQPYWLRQTHGVGSYTIDDDQMVGSPENPDLPAIKYTFTIEGKVFEYDRQLVYKYVDPAKGEIYQPVEITPPVTANIENRAYIFNSQQPQTVELKLKSFKNAASGMIKLSAPVGWKISPESVGFTNKNKGDEWEQNFTITPSANRSQTGVLEAEVSVGNDRKVYNNSILSINYSHIPNITLFPPAQAKLLQLDLKIAGKKIGYINGAGDLVPDALKQVGYDVSELNENEILNGDLSVYDAIVVGVRAYNVDKRLAIDQPKLLEYVKNGGNLLVQYNNSSGLVTKEIGPYPFKVVNERVTDENAKITILDPNNAVLNYPNKISRSDFDGWIQERGLYFTKDADPQYQKVLRMADPGEGPKDGALITTQYGKGRFIYTSLAFFRQLPAGVPGAYRLFINMLSKPRINP